jgi:hypothetical protein
LRGWEAEKLGGDGRWNWECRNAEKKEGVNTGGQRSDGWMIRMKNVMEEV